MDTLQNEPKDNFGSFGTLQNNELAIFNHNSLEDYSTARSNDNYKVVSQTLTN